jgi:hypothetical protein
MTGAEDEDRLLRLRRRGEVLFQDLKGVNPEHKQLMERAWEEALAAQSTARNAGHEVSRLDSILVLLERITRPSRWLDAQASWFTSVQCCLLDAVAHLGREAPIPPPILVVEPISSPLYVPRTRVPAEWLPQATPADLPLPVVLCPGNMLEEPWAWATLFHELGHHLDKAEGDTDALLAVLDKEDRRVGLGSWTSRKWVGEVVSDLYAGLLGGPGAVETLKAALTTKPYSASHPSDADRATLLDAAWTGVRDGRAPQGDRPLEIVIRALVERFLPWGARVRSDCEQASGDPGSARLLPGHLRRQYSAGQKPEALRKACQEAFASGRLDRPSWALTEAHLKTLAEAMRNLVETRVQPGPVALKVPPLELLIRHDRISFVGATHGQLLPKLQEAMKYREKPYEHIELFALSDAPLRELTLGGRTGEALIQERDESLRALREYLTEQGIPHRVYLYAQPYVFASFWDVEPREGSPDSAPPAHIHVSNALWGMDLRSAVGQDLESPAGQPLPRAMQARVEALANLRSLSTPLP